MQCNQITKTWGQHDKRCKKIMRRIKLEVKFNDKPYKASLKIKSDDATVVNYAKNKLIKHLYDKVASETNLKSNFSFNPYYITPEMRQNCALQNAIEEAFDKAIFTIEDINE